MLVKKTKLEKKTTMMSNLPSLNLNVKALKVQRYFSIRHGVLYQYERKTARVMMDRFKINNISAMSLKTDENNQATIRLIYKKYYVILTPENDTLAQKWFNSLQYVKDNSDQYVYNAAQIANRYQKLKVYERITGKSVFTDYDVLLERYEIDKMQEIWVRSHIYMLKRSMHPGFGHTETEESMMEAFVKMLNAGAKEKGDPSGSPEKLAAAS